MPPTDWIHHPGKVVAPSIGRTPDAFWRCQQGGLHARSRVSLAKFLWTLCLAHGHNHVTFFHLLTGVERFKYSIAAMQREGSS